MNRSAEFKTVAGILAGLATAVCGCHFIQGGDGLRFASLVEGIDLAKSAEIDHVVVLTPQMTAGH